MGWKRKKIQEVESGFSLEKMTIRLKNPTKRVFSAF
jgi:hypothetical protein